MKITTYANPRQVVLITSRWKGKDNIISVSWHTPLSFNPKIYAVSIGKTRFSHELISKSKCFVVNFMSEKYEKEIYYCGSKTGLKVDKFKEVGFTKEESKKINCPRIKEALAFFECEVINEIDVGDHTLFIGKVVNEGFKRNERRLFHIHTNKFTTTK